MKISNRQYAEALYETTKDKTQSRTNEAVDNFVKILAKNNQIKNIKSIIEKFSEVWNKKEGIVEAEIVSREKLDGDLRVEIEKYVSNKYNGKKVEIINKVDENIKGGIIIRVGDDVMDGSVSRQLFNLKNKLEN
jgi:F-type H+-transporting ATPase subunit delta